MNKIKNMQILLYLLVIFAFSVGVRMFWVYVFNDASSYKWNGQFMINTNDGYYFAEGARDIIAGFHQPNDLSPINNALSIITAYISMALPFSFESVIFYLSAFFSSFVGIGVFLIGKSLQNAKAGFIAGLLSSIAWSYYNRTMVGYYDTDMLNIVFPVFILWSMIAGVNLNKYRYAIYAFIFIVLSLWWYPQSFALIASFFVLMFIYTLVFDRHNSYMYEFLSIMLLGIITLNFYIKIAIFIALLAIFLKMKISKKMSIVVLVSMVILFLFFDGFDKIWGLLQAYVFRKSVGGNSIDLKFFSVVQTVREASSIPFNEFANRISGHVILFFISIVGYIYLCFKHKVMLLSLCMVALGFLGYNSGLRFTIYAVPAMALGIAFLVVKISQFIPNKKINYLFLIIATCVILWPNLIHVKQYLMPTVFNASEVKVLDELKKTASREDYVVAWWDYGYPIRYYADVKTLVDGGKHEGDVNYAPSFILTHTQKEASNMARLEVEYTEKKANMLKFEKNATNRSTLHMMSKDYGFSDVNDFIYSLQSDIDLPKKTRDIYLYLPLRMIGIYPTVGLFSSIDLNTGQKSNPPYLHVSSRISSQGDLLDVGQGVVIDQSNSTVKIQNSTVLIKSFYVTDYVNDKLSVSVNHLHKNGQVAVIFAKQYNAIFVMDLKALNSTYIQLFLLENYDKELFEPVSLGLDVKIYRAKK